MEVVSLADDPTLMDRLPFGPGWPKFIFADPVAKRLMPAVDRAFADFNLVLLDGDATVVAGGWGVPLAWDGSVEGLPDGWDAALERAVTEHESERAPDTLCAMATEVVSEQRGLGLSARVLAALRDQAEKHGLSRMIAPARPTLKHQYPLTAIERYAHWTREDGSPFDPWIRTHWRLGARIVATTPKAMKIVAPVAHWEEMTGGMAFPESGDYIVPDALAPVSIDREANEGVYFEPAIWMLHGESRLGPPTPEPVPGRGPQAKQIRAAGT